MANDFVLSKRELDLRCPLLKIEITSGGIIGRHPNGDIVVRVTGKITNKLITQFSDGYQKAVKAGLIKKGLPH